MPAMTSPPPYEPPTVKPITPEGVLELLRDAGVPLEGQAARAVLERLTAMPPAKLASVARAALASSRAPEISALEAALSYQPPPDPNTTADEE